MCDSLTLAELSEVLAMPDLLPGVKVTRALNLDGGTSSGFYFDTGAGNPDVYISPIKRVRNFVGISPR
ncbi:phosphodiester glycosidase family protein [Verrucomicrobiales bacterium]|nr:phosphodiester glycosidase family protein [Verrucomicrobiales bacterium]